MTRHNDTLALRHMRDHAVEAVAATRGRSRKERFWQLKPEYLHSSPCRKGLVRYPEQERFSSARFYADGCGVHSEFEVTQLEWWGEETFGHRSRVVGRPRHNWRGFWRQRPGEDG